MNIKITAVGQDDAFFSTREKFIGKIFKVDFKDIINWKNGWFGMENVTSLSDGQKTSFHQIKFEELRAHASR